VVDVPEGGGGVGVRGEGVGASRRSVFSEETLFLRTRAPGRRAPDRVSTRASEGKKKSFFSHEVPNDAYTPTLHETTMTT
jgi:hypothetical protein